VDTGFVRLTVREIDIGALHDRVRLFGEYDRNLSAIEETLGVRVQTQDDTLVLSGETHVVERAANAVARMLDAAVKGTQLTPHDVALAVADTEGSAQGRPVAHTLLRTPRGEEIRPRSAGQRMFVDAMEGHTLVLGIGPAGTGKTFLSVVMAVRALRGHEVERVILSRPAIEAGERLGFLPGDFREKLDPYMRPLYDALSELLDEATVAKYLERGTVEVAPLAYMRGRTLSNAFVILDEAQNATASQLKMFLTRLGSKSKMVVCGDVTQIDLVGEPSGLIDAMRRLAPVEDIRVVELDETDVVRHPLVARIVRAYTKL
jgi:phosphate starvation-inducible PhoH-like protein